MLIEEQEDTIRVARLNHLRFVMCELANYMVLETKGVLERLIILRTLSLVKLQGYRRQLFYTLLRLLDFMT